MIVQLEAADMNCVTAGLLTSTAAAKWGHSLLSCQWQLQERGWIPFRMMAAWQHFTKNTTTLIQNHILISYHRNLSKHLISFDILFYYVIHDHSRLMSIHSLCPLWSLTICNIAEIELCSEVHSSQWTWIGYSVANLLF